MITEKWYIIIIYFVTSRLKLLTWALFCNWTSNDGLWRKVFVGSVPKCIYFSLNWTEELTNENICPSRSKILTWALFCNWTSNDGLWRKVFVGSVPKCIYFSSKRTEEMTSLYVRVHKWLTQIANILCDFCTVNYFCSLDFTIKSS